MREFDQTFDPNILIGRCDLISWFSNFALYLGTRLVYACISQYNIDPKVVLYINVTLFHGSVILHYILTLNWYIFILLSANQ